MTMNHMEIIEKINQNAYNHVGVRLSWEETDRLRAILELSNAEHEAQELDTLDADEGEER